MGKSDPLNLLLIVNLILGW